MKNRDMLLTFILVTMLGIFFSTNAKAQHCSELTVPNNSAFARLQDGMGFIGSYALPCISEGTTTEISIPFKTFRTIAHLNGDDTVYKMKIESITNLPVGMCWVTNSADNTFNPGEGGTLIVHGMTTDNAGQYNLNILLSFDTNGDGTFDRANVPYSKVSKSGRMILRVINATAACERINYDLRGNIAGEELPITTAQKQ